MTSPDDVIFLKFSEIYGQYFPLSNFKKKDTLVFSSLSSIRLGLSPKGLVKRKRPKQHLVKQTLKKRLPDVSLSAARSEALCNFGLGVSSNAARGCPVQFTARSFTALLRKHRRCCAARELPCVHLTRFMHIKRRARPPTNLNHLYSFQMRV